MYYDIDDNIFIVMIVDRNKTRNTIFYLFKEIISIFSLVLHSLHSIITLLILQHSTIAI